MVVDADIVMMTDRMILRRLTVDDEDLLYQLVSNPDVMRFLSRTYPTREDVREALLTYMDQYESDSRIGRFAACDREHGRFIGRFSLRWYVHETEMSLGYRLIPQYWGRGLATEGAIALVL